MDNLKLLHLLSRHTTRDLDKLELTRRVASEHLFVSVDDAINYLTHIVSNSALNPDDPMFVSFKDSPIIVISIIDEAVCSIMHEIYQQMDRKDNDMLAYIRHRISEFKDMIMNKVARNDANNWPFYDDLYNMIQLLDFMSFPVYHREESFSHQISYAYYTLMYKMYKCAKPRDEYFDKLEKYYSSKRV